MSEPRYSAELIAQRGEALYEREIRAQVEPGQRGRVLVLDIDTGEYEVDADHLTALRRARARHPDGAFYALRIGHPALGRIGGQSRDEDQ